MELEAVFRTVTVKAVGAAKPLDGSYRGRGISATNVAVAGPDRRSLLFPRRDRGAVCAQNLRTRVCRFARRHPK